MAQEFYDIEVLTAHPEAPRSDVAKRVRLYALDENEDGSYYSYWIQDGVNKYPILLSGPASASNNKSTAPISGAPDGEYIPLVDADGYGAASLPGTPAPTIQTGPAPTALLLPQGVTDASFNVGDTVVIDSISAELDELGNTVHRANLIWGAATGGGFPSREEIVHTTASLADLAEEDDQDITLYMSVAVLKVEVDRACRVRLYADAASRTADLDRDFEYPAADGIGVYLDFQFSAAGSIICSPQILASDMKGTPDGNMPVAIQNRSGATSTVEVTFTVLQREE
jgi:hypothetical protein